MAYVNQEKKAKIMAALKAVVPADWKWTLAVQNHSTIVMTIRSGPEDLLAKVSNPNAVNSGHASLNTYYIHDAITDDKLRPVFVKIVEALNTDNHDNSDIQTDYFDVGHYVTLNIGQWNNPYLHVLPRHLSKKPSPLILKAVKQAEKFAQSNGCTPAKVAFWEYSKYLPTGWALLSPGKKAAATKQAIKTAQALKA